MRDLPRQEPVRAASICDNDDRRDRRALFLRQFVNSFYDVQDPLRRLI